MDIREKRWAVILIEAYLLRLLKIRFFNLAPTCLLAVCCSLFYTAACNAAEMRLISVPDTADVGEVISIGVVFDASNPSSADVLVADAILEYDLARLELVEVHVDDAANSDLFYSYSLTTNTFPTSYSHVDTGVSKGYVQVIAGLPDGQGIPASQADVLLARVDFRVRALPANEVYGHSIIDLVFSGGEGVNDSKIIIADGLGSNVLSRVHSAVITIGPAVINVPIPSWLLAVLATAFAILASHSYRLMRNRVAAHIR